MFLAKPNTKKRKDCEGIKERNKAKNFFKNPK